MSANSSSPPTVSEPRPRLKEESSKQDLTASGDDVPSPTLSRRTPRGKTKRQSRVGVEFTSTISRTGRLSRATEAPVLHQEEQEKNEKRMRMRTFAVQELIESERQYARTLQFMINVAIPLAQGYVPQPIGNVATREPYLPQGKVNPQGPPVLSKEDINLVFGPGSYKLYEGSRHITDRLDREILRKGFERARVGKFLVFAVPFMEREFCPYIARYRLASERWVALNALKTPEMLQYKEAVAEQAMAWSEAGYVVPELAATWSNIGSLIAQSWYRWTKYALLVGAIIAHTNKEDPDYRELEGAREMLKSANARINELGGRWTVIGALLSGKGIEGAVATRSNTGVKLVKTRLMTRLFKKLEIEGDPGLELEGHLRRLQKLDSDTIDLIDNTRAWIDAAAEGMDGAVLSTIRFADSIYGHRDQQWEELYLAMIEDLEAGRSRFEATFDGVILPSIEKLRHSMNGPLTVVDAAFTMQRQYIPGVDCEAEGAKNVFETYAEICTQLDDEIPKYVQMYLRGVSVIVLRLSTAQAQYYDDTSKVFEVVFKEKGLKGDSESYRRDRPNGEAPKLRAVSIYQAIAEDRLPESKGLDYGSYGCGEGHTRKIWEETAGDHLSRLVARAATTEDRVKEYLEWRKKHRGESTGNTSVSLFSRLTSKSRPSIGSRSTTALNEMRDNPTSTPPESPLGAGLNVGQRSPSSPTPASLPSHGNLHSRQGSTGRMIRIGAPLQRTATAPSTMGLPHSPPARAPIFTLGHHRSQSHGYPLATNKALPAVPFSSEGPMMGGPPTVPPRPPDGHRRERSEGQALMGGPKSHIGQPAVSYDIAKALGKQPNTCQVASAQPVTVVASVARPISKQLIKSNLTQKLQNHQQASSSMQPANAPPSMASQYPLHAKYGRSKSQPRVHGQPQAEIGYTAIVPPLPSRPRVPVAPKQDGNQASAIGLHPSNATIESPSCRTLPNFLHPSLPATGATCLSIPLSKSVPSTSDIGNRQTTRKVLGTEDLPPLPTLTPPITGSDVVARRDNCIPREGKVGRSENLAKNDPVWRV